MFRVCVCRYQHLLWNLNKPINPCRSRRLYFLLRCPERPCPHIYCFFYYEHQRFLSNKERAYVAAWGRQGKSASPSVFYQSAPPFFKKPLVATAHVLDRRDSSHKWKWSFFRKVHSAGADRLDTECSCRWVTCIHRRRVASMLLAVSPLLPWWHVNQMSIRCQSKPNVQLSPEQHHHQCLSACKKLTIPTVFWSIISNNRCILWYIFFLGEWKPPELQQQVLLSLIIFTIKCENRHKAQNKSSLCFLVSSKQSKKNPQNLYLCHNWQRKS